MAGTTYQVVVTGLREGAEREQAIARMATLLRFDAARVEALLGSLPAVVKDQLDRNSAETAARALVGVGAVCVVQRAAGESSTSRCPACDYRAQPADLDASGHLVECPSCGVIVAKATRRATPRPQPRSAPAATSQVARPTSASTPPPRIHATAHVGEPSERTAPSWIPIAAGAAVLLVVAWLVVGGLGSPPRDRLLAIVNRGFEAMASYATEIERLEPMAALARRAPVAQSGRSSPDSASAPGLIGDTMKDAMALLEVGSRRSSGERLVLQTHIERSGIDLELTRCCRELRETLDTLEGRPRSYRAAHRTVVEMVESLERFAAGSATPATSFDVPDYYLRFMRLKQAALDAHAAAAERVLALDGRDTERWRREVTLARRHLAHAGGGRAEAP